MFKIFKRVIEKANQLRKYIALQEVPNWIPGNHNSL